MKFVRFDEYLINVAEIQMIKHGPYNCCTVFLRDGGKCEIKGVDEEAFENAVAYICQGGNENVKTN